MTPLQSHRMRTFATPALFAIAAWFTGRYIQYFPGATKNSLLSTAWLSGAGVMGSGMLISDPAADQRRRICIVVGLVLSHLAIYYGFEKKIPVKTMLRLVAAEAAIVVAAEGITSESLQGRITKSKDRFSRNRTKNHLVRTFGVPTLFAAMAFFAGTQRYIQYFPGATRKSLWCAAGLSGAGVMGSGMLISDPAANQRRRICMAVGLVLSNLAIYYGFKKTIPWKATLRFVAVEAAIAAFAEVVTTESLQVRVAEAREKFLRNRARSHAARTFAPPVLFAVAALFASMQCARHYFPGATRKSLLCAAGLSGAGVVGSGVLLSDQESDQRRRICIATSLVLSSLVTYYGFKKGTPLKTMLCFSAVEAAIVAATEALTSGGPQFPMATLKSSLDQAVFSISVPHEDHLPPNVAMTFCVDTSSSMIGDRERDVKKGMSDVLESAAKVAQTIEGANIQVAVVGFSHEVMTICDPTSITDGNVQSIKDRVSRYTSSGATDLSAGLIAAVEKVERMREGATAHTLILLTDGEATVAEREVQEIHRRLSAVNAQLFAVGIGERHDRSTLKMLTSEKGTYIDTTEEEQTIVGAISSIYEQTMAVFNRLELRCSQLGADEWAIGGKKSVQRGSYSVCSLGDISERAELEKTIKIHSKALSSPFDLSQLSFELVFKDPHKKRGIISIPWKANTIIDPSVLNPGV